MTGEPLRRVPAGIAGLATIFAGSLSSLSEAIITEHVSGYAGFLRKPFRIHGVLSALLRVLPSPVDASP